MNQSLIQLRDKFFAGYSALEDKERTELLNDLVNQINSLATEKSATRNGNLTELLSDIFSALNTGKFAVLLAETTDKESFFNFGKYLLNSLHSKPDDEKKLLINIIHNYLDIFRLPVFLKKIYNEKRWEDLILNLIIHSNFNTGYLFRQRVKDYGSKPLFRIIKGQSELTYNWNQVSELVYKYSSAIRHHLDNSDQNQKVAFLTENSLTMAILDLACLTSGIVNVMIPANSVEEHIKFILEQTAASLLFVSDEKQLNKTRRFRSELPGLKKTVLLSGRSSEAGVISFNEFLEGSASNNGNTTIQDPESVNIKSLATIMYTSGTTGEPKGIMFSHLNIVYKRFCRAMALPEIGEQDRFLAYLPLFHTFGRYLEMMGSVFWGAEYVFMENPSADTMIANMRQVKPTIFISIPKKWMELYERIISIVDIETEEDEKIQEVVNQVTGGNLKWGLSAAGYLSPDVFKFFRKYSIELMSGFGMTEATGGITMTPPGKYIPNSLGCALPGIKIKVAEDGELLIKGAYVMTGYFGEDTSVTFTPDGWLPTGDIMQMDENGFIEIIDRKKEIYKNIKGETIAPQKIENYFRDFDSVKQVFLVGDHRPFNTVLIYPNFEQENSLLNEMDQKQLQEYFSSTIVTVNKFLAPFERILDFRIIDRAFSAEKGELTPKGTYKRRVIEKNFAKLIDSMYEKNHTPVYIDELEVRIPNWFLREKGFLNRDIIAVEDGIAIPKSDLHLKLKKAGENLILLGDFYYKVTSARIDLQLFLTNPINWIGNKNLFEFSEGGLLKWYRHSDKVPEIHFHSVAEKFTPTANDREKFTRMFSSKDFSLSALHTTALFLQSSNSKDQAEAVRYLGIFLKDISLPVYKWASVILERPVLTENITTRRSLFLAATLYGDKKNFRTYLELYLDCNEDLLDEELINKISESVTGTEYVDAIEAAIKERTDALTAGEDAGKGPLPGLFNLICSYGINHPAAYKRIRQIIVRYRVLENNESISTLAEEYRVKLLSGFRNWLGDNQKVAVDVETGEEYKWTDVIIFEEGIDPEDKERISEAITETAVLREAVFLFSEGVMIRLNTILPGGIWISFLGKCHEKTVYRVSIQTRLQGAFDIVLNLNKALPVEKVREEIFWLILGGSRFSGQTLTEDFGGYYQKYDLWSEEFVSGDTVARFLQREARKGDESSTNRLRNLWPFFVWNAATAYYNFRKLTSYRYELSDPTTNNIIVPSHDYQTGTRLVSISSRTRSVSLIGFFENFYQQFINATEEQYPFLKKDNIWNYVFSGIINAEGEEKGLTVLDDFLNSLPRSENINEREKVANQLKEFKENVHRYGFLPKRLYFAIKRFHRWFELNKDAALNAQAQMLHDLYETYNLAELEKNFGGTRTRFLLETAFSDSDENLKDELRNLVRKQHKKEITKEETLGYIASIQSRFRLSGKEDFFLTRLSYPHLKPEDSAALMKIKEEGFQTANLVVQFTDYDGKLFSVRSPVSPKEISKLHQLFIEANLLVNFSHEHKFLVAVSERGFLIGGLFFKPLNEETIYMEKIVVSNRYRRKGISEALMNELFNRMKSENYKYVTTGFFRPEYFYRFGFRIERKYSGLVKEL
ncbi:MAG: hypothetical protein Kow0098_24290 [Ignavibacteriaceae bacterium]